MKRALVARLAAVLVLLCAVSGRAPADDKQVDAKADLKPGGARQFKVCGDPNNLPFSNEKLQGIENKIATVVAKDLGETVAYTWWPHQRGVVKRALNTGQCDIMLGIPKGYDQVLWTRPYYRTGYVLAYRKNRKLNLRSLDDPRLHTLKVGVQVNTPPHEALGQRGIADNVVGYQLMFDSNFHAEEYPGKMIEDLIAGNIDVALVWGPIAGYFARKRGAPLEVVALEDDPASGNRFAFDISMGVRKGDKELKGRLEEALTRRHDEIAHILEDFGVPLLPVSEEKAGDKQAP